MLVLALQEAAEHSAAPAAVRVALARLVEAHPESGPRLANDEDLLSAVVAVFGASRSLTELCVADPVALDVLARLDSPPTRQPGEPPADLNRWKRRALLRIAARDLLGLDDLPAVAGQLAGLASGVIAGALESTGASDLCVVGMGKLGGRELNYSSDIDIMFVAPDPVPDPGSNGSGVHDRAARAVMDVARTCYRVDANLRPEGRDGPLTRTLGSYEAYWQRWAQTWEFQALIKARPVAGDGDLGSSFWAAAQRLLWERPFTAEDLRAVRDMKARAEGELQRRGLSEREIKRGRGGIRDIEFAIQLLQLVHGAHDEAIRSANTLEVLAELVAAGYVDPADAGTLDHAYRFLRTVEHRLQLDREQQIHAIPTDPVALERLARAMGYRDRAEAAAPEQLLDELSHLQAAVRSIHEHLFFRPLLDTLTHRPTHPMTPEAVAERLAAFGFTDAARTRGAVLELTRGFSRSSRLMQQMLPVLLGWLSEAPDPDLGLLGLRRLASGDLQAMELAVAFRDSPESARRVCALLGTSRRLSDTLERHPDLIPVLGDDAELCHRDQARVRDGATAAVSWRPDPGDRQRSLHRFRRREELRIAAADLLGVTATHPSAPDPVAVTATELTDLAEAVLQTALGSIESAVPLAVVAMGRFGAAELSYASDLDLLLVHEGSTEAEVAAAEQGAERLVRFLSGSTPATAVYPVDLDLRPEGRGGPLARSIEAYRAYYGRWAQTWERQALLRARPVAGDPELGQRFCEVASAFLWDSPFTAEDAREVRRLKARMEKERIPPGEDPQFHLKLGRGSLSDVEWTAQLLQLRHGLAATGTMPALDALAAAGVLDEADRAVLADAYRFCERTRNRWFLIKGAPDDSLPRQPEQLARLARSLGTTPTELRESYRRVTRRARVVMERLFYGREG